MSSYLGEYPDIIRFRGRGMRLLLFTSYLPVFWQILRMQMRVTNDIPTRSTKAMMPDTT